MSAASWNVPPPNYESQYTTTTLTPYLQLPHLLSLTWLAYPILSLAFVAFRLQLSLATAESAVASAKNDILTSCQAAEQAATSAASMPRVMAVVTNEQFVNAVNDAVEGARFVLTTSLTAVESVIDFVIDTYKSMVLCFLELAVHMALSILIAIVAEANSLLQSAASALRTSIQSDITSANSAITTLVNGVNKINPFSKITPPQITVPSLDALANLTFPSTFQDALTQLNASIPSAAAIKAEVDSLIDIPFELLKKDINDTFAQISFNSSLLPIPAQNRLSFCNDVDTSIVDDIGQDLIKTARIGTIILIGLVLVLIALNCLLTWYKWRCMKAHMEYTRQAWDSDPSMHHINGSSGVPQLSLTDHNLLMLQANSSHPLLTRIANSLAKLLHLSPTQHTYIQWFFHYIFHPPAVAIFLIGFFGLLSVELQLLAMGPLVTKFEDQASSTVASFTDAITTSINGSMYNQSAEYANQVNTLIDTVQSTINDNLFGWVNQTTTGLNNTINTFYTDIQDAINLLFGGTILEQPAQGLVSCLIGSKINSIEEVLTFLQDNLNIDMPRMNQSALVLSPDLVNEAVQPIAAAAVGGGGTDDNDSLLGKLINAYADSLKQERIMFCIFLGIWGVVVLMGLAVIFWHSRGRRMMEDRKRKKGMNKRGQGNALPLGGVGNGSADDANVPASPASWTVSNRVPSPVDNKINSEKIRDIYFDQNQPNQRAEQKRGFIAVIKEKLIPPTPAEENRKAAWLGRMATLFGRNDQHGSTVNDDAIGRPELSTTSEFTDVLDEIDNKSQDVIINEPRSRWSKSTGILSPGNESVSMNPPAVPSTSSLKPPQITLGLGSSTRPTISFPRLLQPKPIKGVSKHSEAHDGVVTQPQFHPQQTQVPIPLHHGFENEYSQHPTTSSQQMNRRVPPPPASAQRYRRSVSFSDVDGADMAGIGSGGNSSQVPYGRRPNISENPFISPDDE